MKQIKSYYVQEIMNLADSVNIIGTVTEERILELDGKYQIALVGYTGYVDDITTEQYIRDRLQKQGYSQEAIELRLKTVNND